MKPARFFLLPVLTVVLSGCTAANHTGVRIADDGVPVVVNCGSWIERVDVTDADTGRAVWSAHAVPAPDGGIPGRATVTLGSPPRQWTEDTELDLDPRPSTWRFAIDAIDEVVVTVADADFETDRVYRPGNRSESASHFDDQTCSGIPVSPTVGRVGFGGAVLIGAAVVAFLRWRRRPAAQKGAS